MNVLCQHNTCTACTCTCSSENIKPCPLCLTWGVGVCPPGFSGNASLGSYLFAETPTRSRADSQTFCLTQQSYLVEFNTAAEVDFLLTLYDIIFCDNTNTTITDTALRKCRLRLRRIFCIQAKHCNMFSPCNLVTVMHERIMPVY